MSPLEIWLDGLKGTQQYYCHLLKNEDEYYAKFSTMRDESVGTSNKILVFNEVLIREMDPHVRSELHGELADLKLQMEGLLVKRRKFSVLWLLPIEKKLKDLTLYCWTNMPSFGRMSTIICGGLEPGGASW